MVHGESKSSESVGWDSIPTKIGAAWSDNRRIGRDGVPTYEEGIPNKKAFSREREGLFVFGEFDATSHLDGRLHRLEFRIQRQILRE